MSDSDDELALIGRTIAGKFAIEAFVGKGAMGAVYRARQTALDRIVAIKVMHPETAADDVFVTRFQREAKAASRLDHPNSIRVIDFGQDDDLLYIAMEYVAGRDLHHVLREGPIAPERIVDILMQALSAIAVAHDMGVVHRDLKPENLMIVEGSDDEGRPRDGVKVCDFGIARIDSRTAGDTGARLSTKGLVVGTPEYMSPEQGRGEPLDGRTDVYSMGVILFQALTGRLPFEAETALGVVLKHVTEQPPRPSEIASGVDPRLEAICLRALEKHRDHRYANARDMRAALKAVVDGMTPAVPVALGSVSSLRAHPEGFERASTLTAPFESDEVRRRTPAATPLATVALDDESLEPAGVPRRNPIAAVIVSSVLVGALSVVAWAAITRSTHRADALPDAAVAAAQVLDASTTEVEPAPDAAPVASASASVAKPPARVPPTSLTSSSPALRLDAGLDSPIDPSRAEVSFQITALDHVSKGPIFAAVEEVNPTKCYRDALKPDAKLGPGTATVSLDIDESGRIALAGLEGTNVPNATGSCIINGLKGREVVNVREHATAKVVFSFRPRPTP